MENVKISAHYVSEETQDQIKELVAPLVARAYEDPAFKAEFVANPNAVIERETEIDERLPQEFHFVTLDKSDPFAVYITLPVNEDNLELSETELEMVAGGKIRINIIKCNRDCTIEQKESAPAEN